jgi:hypothetical protein
MGAVIHQAGAKRSKEIVRRSHVAIGVIDAPKPQMHGLSARRGIVETWRLRGRQQGRYVEMPSRISGLGRVSVKFSTTYFQMMDKNVKGGKWTCTAEHDTTHSQNRFAEEHGDIPSRG